VRLGLGFLSLLFACSAGDGEAERPASGGSAGKSGGAGGALTGGSGGGWPNSGGSSVIDAGVGGEAGASGGSAGAAGSPAPALVCDVSGVLDCSSSTPASYECETLTSKLGNKVRSAIVAVLEEHPAWFDYEGQYPCCPLTLEPSLFMDAVLDKLNAADACAVRDPNKPADEIVVKRNARCSENFVLITSWGTVRNPPKYQVACVPSWL
jgi:hypothetical protein